MIEQVLLFADKRDGMGDLFTEESLRDMAARDPDRFRYDEQRKALIGKFKTAADDPADHLDIFGIAVKVGGKNRISMLQEQTFAFAKFKLDGRTYMCRKSDVPALRSETETTIKCVEQK